MQLTKRKQSIMLKGSMERAYSATSSFRFSMSLGNVSLNAFIDKFLQYLP
jgi:hypothetical protein